MVTHSSMKQLVDDRLILNLVKKGSVDDYQKFLIIVYNFYQFQKRFIQPFRVQKMIQKKIPIRDYSDRSFLNLRVLQL